MTRQHDEMTRRDDKRRDPFNQNSNRSDREKRTTSKGGPVFSKLFRLDRTDPLSFGPKFPEILVEWIAPKMTRRYFKIDWTRRRVDSMNWRDEKRTRRHVFVTRRDEHFVQELTPYIPYHTLMAGVIYY